LTPELLDAVTRKKQIVLGEWFKVLASSYGHTSYMLQLQFFFSKKKDQLIVIFHVGDLCELAGCTAKRIMVIQMILKRSWVLIVED